MDEARTRRIEALAKILKESDLRCFLVPPSTDLYYLTGIAKEPSERLFLVAVWPDGPLLCLAPELEASWVRDHLGECILFTWKEGENPYRLVRSLLGGDNALSGPVAIGGALATSHFLRITVEVGDVPFVDGTPYVQRLRATKGPEEIDALAESCRIADEVMVQVPSLLQKGLTELEVALEIAAMFLKRGASKPWASVASGPNTSYPHHESSSRKIEPGEIVMVDTGAVYEGYNSDITRTFFLGKAPDEIKKVYDAVHRAQDAAMEKAVEGSRARDLDVAARRALLESGLLHAVKHRTGHGLGLDIHEAPYISDSDETPLEAGMCFTVEPGAYLDGRFGVRIEDVVVITPDGGPPRVLNSAPKEFELL